MTLGITIRRATPGDALALAELAERTFRTTFEADNTAEDMNGHCQRTYSVELQGAELANPEITTLVAEDTNGALVAYAQLRVGPAPPTIPDEATIELWRFYVDLPHHGRGLAQQLMTVVLEAAEARGSATMWLGVWEKNHRAQAFYRKFGFVDVGAHEFRLGNDLQTDRVMVRAVAPA